jgi:hypothetical protein
MRGGALIDGAWRPYHRGGLATTVTFTKSLLDQISLGLAAAAAIFLLVVPVYWGSGGSNRTLIKENGQWVISLVMFPVVAAFLPVVFRKQAVRVIAAALLGGFAMIGSFTIGFLYLPAAIVMFLASRSGPSATSTLP